MSEATTKIRAAYLTNPDGFITIAEVPKGADYDGLRARVTARDERRALDVGHALMPTESDDVILTIARSADDDALTVTLGYAVTELMVGEPQLVDAPNESFGFDDESRAWAAALAAEPIDLRTSWPTLDEVPNLTTDPGPTVQELLDKEHGVGKGTEFPELTAEPLTKTDPDGTVTDGVAIVQREHPLATVRLVSETYVFSGSSNVHSVTLDISTGVALVTFHSGARHRYGGFSPELLAEWIAAPSAGSWFHKNVRSKPDAHPMLGADNFAKLGAES